ncbi:MAG: agmatine deiminase family protein [Deltaproteobacteria bacterium]|nr:agmatine deiminase family protein [Deltaproteobacteria bacterium]
MTDKTNLRTPSEIGFRMPAEWETHEATWLTWPHDPGTWPGKVDIARQAMARWVREITRVRPGAKRRREIVNVIARDDAMRGEIKMTLDDWDIDAAAVKIHVIPNNDVWIRDYGPIFITRDGDPGDGLGCLAVVDWGFDAWGGKGEKYYGESLGLDNQVSAKIAEIVGVPRFVPGEVLEGGGIEVDGEGSLMAATQCLLAMREREGASLDERRTHMERALTEFLGVRHFVWVDNVDFEGDDTDGHIDNLARFVAPGRILTVTCDDPKDPLHDPLRRHLDALRAKTDITGRPYDIVTVPLPAAFRFRCLRDGAPERWRYPTSYANFYIANNVVLVPTYADNNDRRALAAIATCFPDRAVVGIDCCDYILGQGAIHCSTQQQPESF